MEKKRITILPHEFDNNDYFLLKFNYDESLISIAQSIGCRWVVEGEGWTIYRSKSSLNTLVRAFGDIAIVDTSKIGFNSKLDHDNAVRHEIPEEYLELLIQQEYSASSVQVYASFIRELAHYIRGKALNKLTPKDIIDYQNYLVQVKKVSGSTRIMAFDAIKLYCEKILKWDWGKFEKLAQKSKSNDQTLDQISKKDITRMTDSTDNLKHKAIVELLYYSGLNSHELINLQKKDVDLGKGKIFVRGGLNVKDKLSNLPDKSKKLLNTYLKSDSPEFWLFEDQKKNQYSVSGILSLIRGLSFKAGLGKITGLQMLQSSSDNQYIDETENFKANPPVPTKQDDITNFETASNSSKTRPTRNKYWGS